MKKIVILSISLLIVAGSPLQAQEKRSRKERQQEQMEKVQKMVDAQDYKFVAQQALPMAGRSIILTSEYDVRVSKDSVNAYLPYYGRAYVAPTDPTEGGVKFISTQFDYQLEKAKRGGWVALITTNDTPRQFKITLHITTTGSATLSVNDPTRQTISFNGYIEERKK